MKKKKSNHINFPYMDASLKIARALLQRRVARLLDITKKKSTPQKYRTPDRDAGLRVGQPKKDAAASESGDEDEYRRREQQRHGVDKVERWNDASDQRRRGHRPATRHAHFRYVIVVGYRQWRRLFYDVFVFRHVERRHVNGRV